MATQRKRKTVVTVILAVVAVVVFSGVSAAALTGWTPGATGLPEGVGQPANQ